MGAWSHGPTRRPDGAGEIIWLFDPGAGPPPAEEPHTPGELFAALVLATAQAGLDEVLLRGVVRGTCRRGRICTFELVEHGAGGHSVDAVVHTVVLAEDLRRVESTLVGARSPLADEMEVTVAGQLCFDPPLGGFTLVARSVELHTS